MVKTDNGSWGRMIYELWEAPTKEELVEEYNKIENRYPAPGYGTMIYDIRCLSDGKWHAKFARCTSCD